jgi:hypothetical protein
VLGLICSLSAWADSSRTAVALAMLFSFLGEGVTGAAAFIKPDPMLEDFCILDFCLATGSLATAGLDYGATF